MKKPPIPEPKFPNISRFITELPRERQLYYLKIFCFSFVSTFLLVSIMLRGYQLVGGLHFLRVASAQRQEIEKERVYWEDVVKRHEGYRDVYFKLAVLSYQLGETDKARTYLRNTLDIDPNFKEGREFAKKVGL